MVKAISYTLPASFNKESIDIRIENSLETTFKWVNLRPSDFPEEIINEGKQTIIKQTKKTARNDGVVWSLDNNEIRIIIDDEDIDLEDEKVVSETIENGVHTLKTALATASSLVSGAMISYSTIGFDKASNS